MISITNVSKSFGKHPVLVDVSLEVTRSQVIAIVGPSGAGKSTLLRSVNALEKISHGEIKVDGVSVHSHQTDLNKLRGEIGFVFQSFNLYSHLTAIENIKVGPIHVKKVPAREAEAQAAELMNSLGLSDKLNSYPSQLSGGQQQRVAIARALAMKPKVMLFDEPTSALDPEMIKEVLDSMRSLALSGMTMMIVTHEMGFARDICDHIVFMDNGKVVEVAPPETFFKAPASERARTFLSKVLEH